MSQTESQPQPQPQSGSGAGSDQRKYKLPIPPEAVEYIQKYGNKSNAIRALYESEMTISAIAKLMGVKYQHVRNVLTQPQKRKIKEEKLLANPNYGKTPTNKKPSTEALIETFAETLTKDVQDDHSFRNRDND